MRAAARCSRTRRASRVPRTSSRHATKLAATCRFISRNAAASAAPRCNLDVRSSPSHAPKVSPSSRLERRPSTRRRSARFSVQTADHALKTGRQCRNFHSRSTWMARVGGGASVVARERWRWQREGGGEEDGEG